MALLGIGFNSEDPGNNELVSHGPEKIREIKQTLKDFFSVSFDLNTGSLRSDYAKNILRFPLGAAGTALTSNGSQLDPSWKLPTNIIPAGGIIYYAGSKIPDGYLICDGREFPISSFPELASCIGFSFGGDGLTTFAIPDYCGRSPISIGVSDSEVYQPDGRANTVWSLGLAAGYEQVPLETTQINGHGHVTPHVWVSWFCKDGVDNLGYSYDIILQNLFPQRTSETGGGDFHNNLQPVIALNIIIKT